MHNKKILIPSDGNPKTEDIITLICALGKTFSFKIVFLYIVIVPRDLQLHSRVAEYEELAEKTLEKALKIAKSHGVEIETEKVYARNLEDSILSSALELKCDVIALAHEDAKYKFIPSPSANIYQRAKCDVWIFNNK